MNRKWLVGLLVMAVALSICVALAIAEGETVVYYACVNNSSGTIRMISEGEGCGINDNLIEWNQVGPIGPQGEQGLQGEQGPPGDSWSDSHSVIRTTAPFEVPYPGYGDFIFRCPNEEFLLNGGYSMSQTTELYATSSIPSFWEGSYGW